MFVSSLQALIMQNWCNCMHIKRHTKFRLPPPTTIFTSPLPSTWHGSYTDTSDSMYIVFFFVQFYRPTKWCVCFFVIFGVFLSYGYQRQRHTLKNTDKIRNLLMWRPVMPLYVKFFVSTFLVFGMCQSLQNCVVIYDK